LPIVIATASPVMGRIAARIGSRLPLALGSIIAAVGFLLATRVQAAASYWSTVLPALLVIAAGMAGAVAPLTTAVLTTAPKTHTGLASGFNSAVARTGGLIATALAAGILDAHGEALDVLFRHAAIVAAAAAFGAGISALVWLRGRRG
jgi:MFS family permease